MLFSLLILEAAAIGAFVLLAIYNLKHRQLEHRVPVRLEALEKD